MISNSVPTVIRNGVIFKSNGDDPQRDGELHIVDGKITYVGAADNAPNVHDSNSLVIDAQGGTILPGLIESHFHPSYFNVETLEDLDIKYPVEYVTLLASQNAACALDQGYTSARSGGSLFNIDVWLKKAICEEVIRGPRLTASGREICGVGGLMDWNPDYRKIGMDGLVLLVNGPSEATAAVRKLVKDGVEWIKTYPTGDAASPDANDHHTLCMTFDEMRAVVDTAHNHNLKVTGHCRATQGIKNALLAGFDSIEHGTFMDDETMQLLLERDVPVVPALYFEKASIDHGSSFGMSQQIIDGHQETLDAGTASAQRIIREGGRLGLGGDYGFAWNPHGDYAKELTFFVEHVGLTVRETLTCATRTGAEIIGVQDTLGTLELGKTADVLVVAGDVLSDISLIEDKKNLLAVIQNGIIKAGTLFKSN
ncbi:MAG: amidohydrolase family protein [Planctomycetaceae bacterium]|jgi:imidazolonepropionase-like amidohydrolase|nr:amidohydrolase family protein [Planctomycetaceae bacterium]